MIKIQKPLPKQVYLACSGGVDSMAMLDFLKRKHEVTVLHYNHGTQYADRAENLVRAYCKNHDLTLFVGTLEKTTKPKDQSLEEWWRNCRYEFLDQFVDGPVITGHHLDDCVETWIWSSMHGCGKIIPYQRNNIIRPFRLVKKARLEYWAHKNSVPYLTDPSNSNTDYIRNYIRHKVVPSVLHINPGIFKTIKRKVELDVA